MHSQQFHKNLENESNKEIRAEIRAEIRQELLEDILHILNSNICDHSSHDGKADFRFINFGVIEEIKKLT